MQSMLTCSLFQEFSFAAGPAPHAFFGPVFFGCEPPDERGLLSTALAEVKGRKLNVNN
jgi:hypothetical protein